MSSGYVLSFSDRTFREFVSEATGIDIADEKYQYASGSKANRLRAYIKLESNHHVAVLLDKLVEFEMDRCQTGEGIS